MPSAWLCKNVFQPCDGGPRLLTIYLATLVCPTSMPSLSNSPWIRGAPHRGLAMLISRISLRISGGTVGRPPHQPLTRDRGDRRNRAVSAPDKSIDLSLIGGPNWNAMALD